VESMRKGMNIEVMFSHGILRVLAWCCCGIAFAGSCWHICRMAC